MNCVNCGCRLTFFNETDELWGGTERAFCYSCRQKIAPFLNEQCVGSHVEHLHTRKAPLIARGITAEGYAHLEEYCRHLDTLMTVPAESEAPEQKPSEGDAAPEQKPLTPLAALRQTIRGEESEAQPAPSKKEERELRDVIVRSHHLLRADIKDISAFQSENTRMLSDRFEKMQEQIRLLTYLAITGAGAGVLSFLTLLLFMLLR